MSSWGGYVFLINLIPLHVLALMATGRYSHRVYIAYSTVYTVGTILSMQISFVGFQPVQSSEHMAVSFLNKYFATYFKLSEMICFCLIFYFAASCFVAVFYPVVTFEFVSCCGC